MKRLVSALEDQLNGKNPQWPDGSAIFVRAFGELSATRTYGANGPNPIAYAEIAAWAGLQRVPLQPDHVRCIIAMDQVWLDHAYRERKVPDGVKKTPPRSEEKITAALFDLAVG